MSKEATRNLHERGVDHATRFLERQGYEVVESGWTCAAGEADIIARCGEWVVFVGVSIHVPTDGSFPDEGLDDKRSRWERIASIYLQSHDFVDAPVRFDVMSYNVLSDDRAFIRHHINAFSR